METEKYKSLNERRAIVEDVTQRFRLLGIGRDFPPIAQLFDTLDAYIALPEDADAGFSGTIPFPEINKELHYVLPVRKCNQASVRMVPVAKAERPGIRKVKKAPEQKKDTKPTSNIDPPGNDRS